MDDYLKKHNYIFCFIICTVYQLFFYKYGLNLWDEGVLPYGALRVLNGEIPRIDFESYPPARYFLTALFFKIFGINLSSIRLLMVLLTSLMVILFYRVSKNLMDRNFAAISSFMLLSAPSMYYNRLFPILTVINIYFIGRYINSSRKFDLALSIFVILLTFLTKDEIGIISSIVLLTVFVLYTYSSSKKESFDFKNLNFMHKIFVSLIIILSVGILVAAIKINLPTTLFTVVFQLHSVWGNPFPSLFPPPGNEFPSFQELFDISLFYLPLVVYLGTITLLLKRKFFFRKDAALIKSNLLILAVLLFGIGTYGLVVWRTGFDNLLRVLPAFYILLCYFLFLFYKKIMRNKTGSEWSNPKRYFRNFIFSVPVLFFPALFIVNFNLHHGFYAGSIGELRKNHLYINLDRARIFAEPREAMWVEEIVLYIKKKTTEDEPIFAMPFNPIWYFLSDRKNPTSYDWVLPQTIKVLDAEQQIIDQLKDNIPKLIIYADIAIDGKEDRRLSNYAPKLFKYISNNYKLTKVVGLFQILERNI